MNGPTILWQAKEQLAEEVSRADNRDAQILSVSPWIAMALLQKAIRRGETALALRAAKTLLEASPEKLWRRMGAIAFEDIGVADPETVALATIALSGKRFRNQIGGEWRVASYIVSRMARTRQCRSADDLLLTAELHPVYKRARSELAERCTEGLLHIATGSADLVVRAIAAWYVIGTDRRPSTLLFERKGDPSALFDCMCEVGLPHSVVEISREGFRRIGEVLCPFMALLFSQTIPPGAPAESDLFPPQRMIRDIPSWAFDMYSREGQAAYRIFLRSNAESARWVRASISASHRLKFLGTAIFRVEGGLVRNRLRWEVGDKLRHSVDVECHGSACPDATDLLALVREDIPAINEARIAHVG